jgi:hypothetical protein
MGDDKYLSYNNYEKVRSLDEIVDEKALVDKVKDLIIEIGELLDKKKTYGRNYLDGPKTEYRNEYNPFERESNNMY